MPYVYVYQCDSCPQDTEVRLCEEFELSGEARVPYRYPDPELYEWPPRRVAGLWSHQWCPTCRCAQPRVLVELERPAEHPVQAFLAAEAQGFTGLECGPCPVCGTPMLVELDGLPCPTCAAGHLRLVGDYEP